MVAAGLITMETMLRGKLGRVSKYDRLSAAVLSAAVTRYRPCERPLS